MKLTDEHGLQAVALRGRQSSPEPVHEVPGSGGLWGLHVRDVPHKGKGVFAGVNIPAGSDVFRFAGPVFTTAMCPNFDESIQVDIDTWMWSSGGIDDLINHSCAPNAGLRTQLDGLWVVSLRDIPEGAEITYDYSTAMLDDPSDPPMACACGETCCRGVVVNFHELRTEHQQHYAFLGALPAFIRGAAIARGIDLPSPRAPPKSESQPSRRHGPPDLSG